MRQRENRPQTVEIGFWKPNCTHRVLSFGFWILRLILLGWFLENRYQIFSS